MAQNEPHFYFLIPLEGYKGNNFNIVSNKKTFTLKIQMRKRYITSFELLPNELVIVVAITLY